jgi:hypothetical protein
MYNQKKEHIPKKRLNKSPLEARLKKICNLNLKFNDFLSLTFSLNKIISRYLYQL